MNKTAIKNFAVWARNKLIADITYRAGLVGVSERGIAEPLPQSSNDLQFFDIGTKDYAQIAGKEVDQRKALVKAIQDKEHDSDYATAFKAVIEEVAYTWFNRLIAIRFMEVNGYLPSRVRVLSSENQAKNEPDFVTTPFDTDMEFTSAEQDTIMKLKDENKLDDLFRMLFIKQCNKLHEILPELFENTNDYTELLLSISFTDSDGIVYHLVHDIDEDDFNIEKEGQVEIIGWMYQYYNIEPKDETFALLKKNVKIIKERIPAATQLFTPDWIVRYMVENSLGRLWVEGHPNEDLKGNWKYYLEEAEQEVDVQAQLEKIRAEYRNLNPEDIKVIDPCMGSGHILVYCFDVLMQIYESQGYTQRDAAQSILENNLFGLDIDKRAAQLSYFAVMMKARQYDRRIFGREIGPHVYVIEESNDINRSQLKYFGAGLNPVEKNSALNEVKGLLDTLVDAKEYGSILNVDNYDWDLLRRFVDQADDSGQMTLDTIGIDETQAQLYQLIEIGQTMAQKYDVVVTNPPYMGLRNMSSALFDYVMKNHKDVKQDIFGVFMKVSLEKYCKFNAKLAMITQHVWMFTSGFEDYRRKLYSCRSISSLVHLGTRAFEEISGEVVQTCAFVIDNFFVKNYKGSYLRLVDYSTASEKEKQFYEKENHFTNTCDNYLNIPGNPVCYWLSSKIIEIFKNNPLIGDISRTRQGLKTSDDKRFIRMFYEVDNTKTAKNIKSIEEAIDSKKKWFWLNKGGQVKWYGNNIYLINWENDGQEVKDYAAKIAGSYSKNITAIDAYFKHCISWPQISISHPSFRYIPDGYIFASAGPSLFVNNEKQKWYVLGLLNSCVTQTILDAINPTINFGVSDILKVPFVFDENYCNQVESLVKRAISLTSQNWNKFELSWDFERHPFVRDTTSIETSYRKWVDETTIQYSELKEIEIELNRIFCKIYGLENELDASVDENTLNISVADLSRDVRNFISYAVGCMFGRYSLDSDGLSYAGGEWDDSKYSTFIPDKDNCIPITDEPYFEDDIVGLFCAWLKKVYGEDILEENLDFIAKALGNKGSTSREVIRNYFLNDFIKDHIKTYQKRPIYWLFDSGKQNGFKALVYMHRWSADTVGNLRVEYLHKTQRIYEREIQRMQETMDNSHDSREINKASKRKEKLQKQLKETKDYDTKLAHIALSRIDIDLDDGVKVNYEKVQIGRDGKQLKILAKI